MRNGTLIHGMDVELLAQHYGFLSLFCECQRMYFLKINMYIYMYKRTKNTKLSSLFFAITFPSGCILILQLLYAIICIICI